MSGAPQGLGGLPTIMGIVILTAAYGGFQSCEKRQDQAESERAAAAADEARDALGPQIAQHGNAIADLEARLDALADENERLDRKVDYLRMRVDDLEGRLEDLEYRRGR